LKYLACWHWSRAIHRNVLRSFTLGLRVCSFIRFIVGSMIYFSVLSNCIGINAVLDFLSFKKVWSVDEPNRYSFATTQLSISYHIDTSIFSYFPLLQFPAHKIKTKERNHNSSNGRLTRGSKLIEIPRFLELNFLKRNDTRDCVRICLQSTAASHSTQFFINHTCYAAEVLQTVRRLRHVDACGTQLCLPGSWWNVWSLRKGHVLQLLKRADMIVLAVKNFCRKSWCERGVLMLSYTYSNQNCVRYLRIIERYR
jgi:hypothetical protein